MKLGVVKIHNRNKWMQKSIRNHILKIAQLDQNKD